MCGWMKAVVLSAIVTTLLVPVGAQANITIGSNLATNPGIAVSCVGGCTYANTTLASGSGAPGGLTSPANGTIVAWRIRTGAPPVGMPVVPDVAVRVVKDLGNGLYTGAGTSTPMSPPANATSSFPTKLPISIGDLIGIDCCVDGFGPRFIVSSPGSTRLSWLPLLADGDPGRAPSSINSQELALNAEIEPTSSFTLGPVTRNKERGTATLSATTPNPGELTGSGKGVKVVRAAGAVTSKAVIAPGTVNLTIRAKGKKKRKLNKTGKVRVRPKITFTPTGGNPRTESKKLKLKKR